jgi:hypothetical protein
MNDKPLTLAEISESLKVRIKPVILEQVMKERDFWEQFKKRKELQK